MTPKIIDKTEKRSAILLAAMEVIAARGFDQTKMSDIAERAGIGKGTIYEYFRSKEAIFVAAFNYYFEDIERHIGDRLPKAAGPVEKLMLFVRTFSEYIASTPSNHFEIVAEFWAESIRYRDEEHRRIISFEQKYEEFRGIIGSILEEGRVAGAFRGDFDSRTAASLLIGAMDGIYFQWLMNRRSIDLTRATETLLHIFIQGLK